MSAQNIEIKFICLMFSCRLSLGRLIYFKIMFLWLHYLKFHFMKKFNNQIIFSYRKSSVPQVIVILIYVHKPDRPDQKIPIVTKINQNPFLTQNSDNKKASLLYGNII